MTVDKVALGVVGVTTPTFVYHVATGNVIGAVFVPIAGYSLSRVGLHINSERLRDIGQTIILTSLLVFPGTLLGCGIHYALSSTLAAKGFAYIAGAGITYKIFHAVLDASAKAVVEGIR